MAAGDTTIRSDARYGFTIPVSIELSRGMFRPADRVPGVLVDMSKGGAAITTRFDPRLRLKKRYRVIVDDHAGIIALKNLVTIDAAMVRMGVQFTSLGLELQEIVADALEEAQWLASRLDQERSVRLRSITAGR